MVSRIIILEYTITIQIKVKHKEYVYSKWAVHDSNDHSYLVHMHQGFQILVS